MHTYICMYVCMYACMYACLYVRVVRPRNLNVKSKSKYTSEFAYMFEFASVLCLISNSSIEYECGLFCLVLEVAMAVGTCLTIFTRT
uniref:Uncharacterized protein n=1 Tax=Octopus bimaculoides TaxID=37653 RepID=A0A0L8GLF3_OCTBM